MNEKIHGGYIIKARCIQESFVAHCTPCTRELWDYLLMHANHKEKKYMDFFVKRGEIYRTYKQIREDLSWWIGCRKCYYSETQMKDAMKALMKAGMVTLMKTPRGNLITVLNYAKYQDSKNYEDPNEDPRKTPGRPQEDPRKAPAYNKNEKNVKNENINKNNKAIALLQKERERMGKLKLFSEMTENDRMQDSEYESTVKQLSVKYKLADEIVRAELDGFTRYWVELDTRSGKQRWEKETTWETHLRIGYWINRYLKYQKPKNSGQRGRFIS